MLRVVVTMAMVLLAADAASAAMSVGVRNPCTAAEDLACGAHRVVQDAVEEALAAKEDARRAAASSYDSSGTCRVSPDGGVMCTSSG